MIRKKKSSSSGKSSKFSTTRKSSMKRKPIKKADLETFQQEGALDHSDLEGSGFFTDPEEIEQERRRQAARQAGEELWKVKFRCSSKTGPKLIQYRRFLGAIYAHNIPTRANNGQVVTEMRVCTSPQSVRGDCAFCDHGYRPNLYSIYEVVDMTGNPTKRGEVVKDIVSLYIVNETRNAILKQTLLDSYDNARLTTRVVKVSPVGSGAQTQHIYTMQDELVPTNIKNLPGFDAKTVKAYLPALEREAQEALVEEAEPLRNNRNQGGGNVSGGQMR